ncbi:LuxR family transcriptional regulator [Actinoplanes sp. NPDC051343]|jgi:DNA-binding NarL/FixJ family response regulator|uniref:LuxR family transcriptional regulator n=1 Tax=Actinoplanes sp. NPDC051343 TaxID=3363906 RepID=UPI003799B14A
MHNAADLGPVERRIAMLAATGLTNKEIGNRLFLSGRTVGTYLYGVFPKLGVSSRAGLADALQGPAGADDAQETNPAHPARAELAYGQWLRRHRRPRDARPVLQSALAGFQATGADRWAERARGELAATGVTRPGDPERLTPQESAVAELAARGLTNRQIGERLLLSPRTVGSHLGRVFPKLGVGSRAALRGALDRRSALGLTVD